MKDIEYQGPGFLSVLIELGKATNYCNIYITMVTPSRTVSPLLKMHALEKQGEFFKRLENSPQDPAIQGSQVPKYLVSGDILAPRGCGIKETDTGHQGPPRSRCLWDACVCKVLPQIHPDLKSNRKKKEEAKSTHIKNFQKAI